ncbi:148R [Cherax quadricarinatus iridovirus]|uniref:Uncharacterized protein n=1 Tax=Shrimp hemocyte iridescent virus TaxID=2039780 RepID=A0A291B0H9_9VIRU|nr:148R [Cherax quadricarinatus iridovirus]YP_010084760.1 hypothetical protein KM509_gp008 [Shrimp hemocyte iridescent virus]UPA43295.1 hypothetical protein 4TH000021 [Iridovirus CN01]ASZ85128.1 148R [Cherax quadricarinatus iridovirus]ATE87017.1 hypothetical protein [Shrimp hemocyte iridescent virus]UPA43530.1 hypothetical protein 3TG000097 [Iridovirus CN01]UPA43727.1 hypothetical protein 1DG000135 [Iridovirus CN01]
MDKKHFYVKADPDHIDLKDLFGGEYVKELGLWKFRKEMQQQVDEFLDDSSYESEEDCVRARVNSGDKDKSKDISKSPETKRKRTRLHRANSFSIADSTDEECESDHENYRRSRKNIKNLKVADNIEKEMGM